MIIEKEMGVTLANTTMPSPVYMDVKKAPFSLHGFHEPFIRVPADVAKATSEGVARLARQTAGGRVCFQTTSDYIVIHAELEKTELSPNSAPDATASFDIFFKEADGYHFRGVIFPDVTAESNVVEGRVKYGNHEKKDVVIFFPLGSVVKELYIGLREGAELEAGSDYTYVKPIIFYGSSIVHGGGTRAGSPYSAILSRRLDTDYRNLGFSGNAKAEPAILDYIAGLDMSIFVYDYDHNAPTAEFLEETHYAGYRRFREKKPDTPVIMASLSNYHTRIYSWDYFTIEDHEKRRRIIKASYERALAEGDQNVYFVDGASMIPKELAGDATTDGLHPNDLGYHFMANAFGSIIEPLLKNK